MLLLLLLLVLDRMGSGGIDGDLCREGFVPTSDVDADVDAGVDIGIDIDIDSDADADVDTDEEDFINVDDSCDDNGYSFWLSRSSLVLL